MTAGTKGTTLAQRPDLLPAPADPGPKPGGVASHQRKIGHVPGDHRPRSHHGKPANREARQNGGIGANAASLPQRDDGMSLQMLAAARTQIVRESRAGPHKDVVLQHQAIPQIHAALQGHAVSKAHHTFDKSVITDVAVFANHSPAQDMSKGPDACPRADGGTGVNDRLLMNMRLDHGEQFDFPPCKSW